MSRHKRAKNDPLRRYGVLIVPAAITALVVAGVAAAVSQADDRTTDLGEATGIAAMSDLRTDEAVSRNGGERSRDERPPATSTPTPTVAATPTPTAAATTPVATPAPAVVAQLFTTAGLNVRTAPTEESEVLTVLARGTEVAVTDVTEGPWVQIVYDDKPFWVSAEFLAETKPEPDDEISYAECESGSGVEDGLEPDTIRVHRAVCAAFPDVGSYGGLRSGDGGEHGEGRALDIMVSSESLGDEIAAFVRENHEILGVSEVIWWQQIWTVERSGEGWRPMSDRGSDTANHYDHVHVTVYGSAGG